MSSQKLTSSDVSLTAGLPRAPELSDLEVSYGEDRKFIWSIARTMQLLQAFRPEEGALGNGDLSERTGIAKATVSRITYTLTELGYLERTRNRQYLPTSNLLSLSHSVLGSFRIRQLAQRKMQEIANLAGGTVGISWPDKDTMIYIAASIATTSDDLMPEIGTRMSMAKSAAPIYRLWMTMRCASFSTDGRSSTAPNGRSWKTASAPPSPTCRTKASASSKVNGARMFAALRRRSSTGTTTPGSPSIAADRPSISTGRVLRPT